MDIIEAIRTRRSCRTYKPVPLDPSDRKILEDYIGREKDHIGGETTNLRILEKGLSQRTLELNYGMIKGHSTYLLGISGSSPESRLHYGYMMEKAVLRATSMGLASCWIGYFDHSYFDEIKTGKGFEIPSIVILGYAEEKQSRADRITRFAVNASKRLEWQKLFFDFGTGIPLNPDISGTYSLSFEMVRLAPSAGNTQPWRIYSDDGAGEFHFFKKPVSARYEERGLHDIDLGIAAAHFEMASENKGLPGTWIRMPGIYVRHAEDTQYVITWKCG